MSEVGTDIDRVVEDGEVVEELPGEWRATAWFPPSNGTAPTLDEVGVLLRDVTIGKRKREAAVSTMLWWIGDILVYGQHRYGERFSQLLEEADYVEESFHNVARTARDFAPDRRWQPEVVSFWTHSDVRTLNASAADKVLKRYADRLKPQSEQVGAEQPNERTLLNRQDVRQEVRGIRMLSDGTEDAEDALPVLYECPACHGTGRLSEAESTSINRRLNRV